MNCDDCGRRTAAGDDLHRAQAPDRRSTPENSRPRSAVSFEGRTASKSQLTDLKCNRTVQGYSSRPSVIFDMGSWGCSLQNRGSSVRVGPQAMRLLTSALQNATQKRYPEGRYGALTPTSHFLYLPCQEFSRSPNGPSPGAAGRLRRLLRTRPAFPCPQSRCPAFSANGHC